MRKKLIVIISGNPNAIARTFAVKKTEKSRCILNEVHTRFSLNLDSSYDSIQGCIEGILDSSYDSIQGCIEGILNSSNALYKAHR
jgi:hypothetical protein